MSTDDVPHHSDLYTVIYDERNGGPPTGFRCEQERIIMFGYTRYTNKETCGRRTRTERGMIRHLRQVHGIERQGRMFDADEPAGEPG